MTSPARLWLPRSAALAIFAAGAVIGCGGGGGGGGKAGTCVPGMTVACPCLGGAQGVQACDQSGTFSPCQCASGTGGTTGTGGTGGTGGSGGTVGRGGSGGTGGTGGVGGTGGTTTGGSGGVGGTGGTTTGGTGGTGGRGGTGGSGGSGGTGGSPDAGTDAPRGNASLRVKVVDVSDSPITMATVRASLGGAMLAQGMTAASGTVLLSALPAGDYQVEASAMKFDPATKPVTAVDGLTTDLTIQLIPSDAVPAGGTSRAESISVQAVGGTLIVEVDLFVLDRLGRPIDGLAASAFTIPPFTLTGGETFMFRLDSMTPIAKTAKGPYSAYLMLDQSGSITSTDPGNMRLQAAKIFLSKLGTGDQVVVGAFASGGSLPFEITKYGDFTTDGRSYFPTIDMLASKEGGGTPLYKATVAAIQTTATTAPTPNRAALVFTDGEDTGGGWTIDQVIAESKTKGVPLHMVGLGTGTKVDVLARLANQTGGTFMQASRAGELIALYGNLGALLRGATGGYRTRWTVTHAPGSFLTERGWFTTSIRVEIGGGGIVYVPIFIEYPGNATVPGTCAPYVPTPGTCPASTVPCTATSCCPATAPYFCPGSCHSTLADAFVKCGATCTMCRMTGA